VGVACDLGYPCAKFRLTRPFGFRVTADVRDIRQTDGRTTDADDRLMPPPPLRGHNSPNLTEVLVLFTVLLNITILSIIIVLQSVTNVVCPHNGQIL